MKGQAPVGFEVTKADVDINDEQLMREPAAEMCSDIGAVAAFRDAAVVPRLPKTRSGTVLRKTIHEIVDGVEDVDIPATIET